MAGPSKLAGAGAGAKASFPAGAAPGKGKPCKVDPCGKDAIKNVTDCCGSDIYKQATKANGGKAPPIKLGAVSSGFGAETDTSKSPPEITVDSKAGVCDATESVYFELANAASKPEFDKIDKDAAAGKMTRDDYARKNERVEYNNVQKTLKAIDKCKKKWGCGKHKFSFDAFRPAKNFDDYLKNYEGQDHIDFYRNFFDKNYKPPSPPAGGGKGAAGS